VQGVLILVVRRLKRAFIQQQLKTGALHGIQWREGPMGECVSRGCSSTCTAGYKAHLPVCSGSHLGLSVSELRGALAGSCLKQVLMPHQGMLCQEIGRGPWEKRVQFRLKC
jgi:hypothetical protein